MPLLESSFSTPGPERLITLRHGHYPPNDLTANEWQPGDPDPDLPSLEKVAHIGLSGRGITQSFRFGLFLYRRYPNLSMVLSSDWERPVQTAGYISRVYEKKRGSGLTIEKSKALRERDRGDKYNLQSRPWIAAQYDYQTFLDSPATWVPNARGKGRERGKTLVSKAEELQGLWPRMGELALGETLLFATHGETGGGAALTAFGGFGDEELSRPLPGHGDDWWPRTLNNCHGYILEDLTEQDGRYSYRRLMGVDASKPEIRMTNWIAINTP